MGFDDINQETKINDAMTAANMAWWEMELPSGTVFFHPNKAAMIGRSAEDFFHYSSFTELIHPDDYDQTMQAMTDLISGKTDIYETKYRIKHIDGTYKTFYDKGRIVQKQDDTTRIAGMVIDLDDLHLT